MHNKIIGFGLSVSDRATLGYKVLSAISSSSSPDKQIMALKALGLNEGHQEHLIIGFEAYRAVIETHILPAALIKERPYGCPRAHISEYINCRYEGHREVPRLSQNQISMIKINYPRFFREIEALASRGRLSEVASYPRDFDSN